MAGHRRKAFALRVVLTALIGVCFCCLSVLALCTLSVAPARAQNGQDSCVFQRSVPDSNGQPIKQATVVQCNQQPPLSAEWLPVARNLTFAAASAMRDAINGVNVSSAWCVMQRQVLDSSGRPRRQFTAILCKDMPGAGPGWVPVAQNLTFAAASAIRDAGNAASFSSSLSLIHI